MDIAAARFATDIPSFGKNGHTLNDAELDTLSRSRLFSEIGRDRLRDRLKPNGEAEVLGF